MKGTSVGTRFRHVCRAALERGRRARERALSNCLLACVFVLLLQTSRQEFADADFKRRIAQEKAAANERDLESHVACTDRANAAVFKADRATQRAAFSTFQHSETVQQQAGELCSIAGKAAAEVMKAARSLPPSKRQALERAGGALSALTTAVDGLKERQTAVAGKLVASLQEVQKANSAACLAQHGEYASKGRQ